MAKKDGKMSNKSRQMRRRRQLFIARAKIITIFILFILIIVFICSLALGAFPEHHDSNLDITETTADSQSLIDNKSMVTTFETSLPTSKPTKTNQEKLADLEGAYSFSQYNQNCDWSMIVVNSRTPHSADYTVDTVKYYDYNVDVRIINQLSAMIEASKNAGVNLWISSAYRSNDTQSYLYDKETDYYTNMGYSETQARELARKSVAVPGTSEHEIGLAVDFNNVSEDFKYTPEYDWLCKHASEYGFIQRYPEGKEKITDIIFEPWHYRYVGTENAVKINNSGMCLEEYIYDLINK